jgi:hypothetical protein
VYTLKSGPLPSGPHLTFRDEEHLENSWVKVVCNQCGLHFSLGPAVAYPLVGELEIVVPLSKVPMLEKHLAHRLRVEARDARG